MISMDTSIVRRYPVGLLNPDKLYYVLLTRFLGPVDSRDFSLPLYSQISSVLSFDRMSYSDIYNRIGLR